MREFEPNEFVDGTEVMVAKAIIAVNRLKLSKYVSSSDMTNDTEMPYFANLYWMVQHEYDMSNEYADSGDEWIPQMTNSNWQSVRKWLVDNIQLFNESAERYDKVIEGTGHTPFGVRNWTARNVDGNIF